VRLYQHVNLFSKFQGQITVTTNLPTYTENKPENLLNNLSNRSNTNLRNAFMDKNGNYISGAIFRVRRGALTIVANNFSDNVYHLVNLKTGLVWQFLSIHFIAIVDFEHVYYLSIHDFGDESLKVLHL
jgi:uncharacterized protein YvpB